MFPLIIVFIVALVIYYQCHLVLHDYDSGRDKFSWRVPFCMVLGITSGVASAMSGVSVVVRMFS